MLGFSAFYLFSEPLFLLLVPFDMLYLPLYFVYVEWSNKFALKWQLPQQKTMIELYSVLAENLQNIPTIKAFNGYKAASQSFVAQVHDLSTQLFVFIFRVDLSYLSICTC